MLQYTFEALYTPQLVQKRKKWHDGRCLYFGGTKKLVLVDDEGRVMGERFWSGDGVPEVGTTIQLDRFLVELDSLLRVAEKAAAEPASAGAAKPAVRRPAMRPSRTTLGRPLSDVLHEASMQIKPLGSGPIERRVKRVKADKFGGLSPVLFGRPEAPLKAEPLLAARFNSEERKQYPEPVRPVRPVRPVASAEPVEPVRTLESVKPEERGLEVLKRELQFVPAHEPEYPAAQNTGFEQGHDDSELFVEDHFDTFVHKEVALPPPRELAGELRAGGVHAEQHKSVNSAEQANSAAQAEQFDQPDQPEQDSDEQDSDEQDSDDLFSDTEVEVLQIADAPRARRSLFEDMPEEGPVEGPWTKEAYLLFSWHPPQAQVKEEAPV